ncbi:MAG: hypothetical protein MR392_11670 [Roseburia sp.]|nr:hypothetical protein [Roseburia sp.]
MKNFAKIFIISVMIFILLIILVVSPMVTAVGVATGELDIESLEPVMNLKL